MRHVFLSYAREDYAEVARLAAELEAEGFEVWWDRLLRPGKDFNAEIDEALSSASCVVVIWSANSVDSMWVRAEATAGLERDLLVPVRLDGAQPSLLFRVLHTIEFPRGENESRVTALREVVAAVTDHVSLSAAVPAAGEAPSSADPQPEVLPTGLLRLRITVDVPDDVDNDPSRTVALVVSARLGGTAERGIASVSMKLVEHLWWSGSVEPDDLVDRGLLLFELLVPTRLKPLIVQADSVEFELDSIAAGLPWESIFIREDGTSPRSLSMTRSVSRELISARSRPATIVQGKPTALILGDILSVDMFPRLPGARKEAQEVADLLRGAGTDVTLILGDLERQRDVWREVLTALYSRAWSIVHVASFQSMWDVGEKAGLPIGTWPGTDDLMLFSGAMIGQLSSPPRFVMMNGGFDAQVLPRSATSIDDVHLRKSLVFQFLSTGTEVFVGPSGPVDDEAGRRLATSMYASLLDGQTLGSALRGARSDAANGRDLPTALSFVSYGESRWRLRHGS